MSTQDLIERLRAEMEEKYGDKTTPREIQQAKGSLGCFELIEDAIAAAKASQKQLMELTMKKRNEIIAAMRKVS